MIYGITARDDLIPELNDLMAKVKASHGAMLEAKCEELLKGSDVIKLN